MLPFTPEQLNAAIADGRVTERTHPSLPLYIYNYSPEVAFSNHWDAVTLNCRGLILDEEGNIVARPWAKFFNMGQRDNEIDFNAPVEVTDKLDGSLGILYWANDGWAIATRGSFDSKQARHASQLLVEKYEVYLPQYEWEWQWDFLSANTVLFEIIYPINRIVVNYGDMDDLVLLGSVNKEHGYYQGPTETASVMDWPGPVAEVFSFNNFSDALSNWPHREGKEGVVVRSGDKMVKFKQPEYLELHKLVTNANPKTVWVQLAAGKSKAEIVSAFPDEFHDYIGGMIDPLVEAFDKRFNEILDNYEKVLMGYTVKNLFSEFDRGVFARYIKNEKDKRYFFLLLDERSIREVLWNELKPREA